MRLAIAILLLCMTLGGCRPKPATKVPIDPALASLVPQNTTLLAGVRVDKIKSSPVIHKLLAGQNIPSTGEFRRNLGIDPMQDIWELLIASNGQQTLVGARGRFSETGLEPKLKNEGAARFSYKGLTLFGDENRAIAFLNASTAAAGPTSLLRNVIDQRNKSNGIPPRIVALMKTLEETDQIWAAGAPPALSGAPPGTLGNLANLARGLQSFTAGADLRAGVASHAVLNCARPEDATQLHGAMRALLGLARLNTPTSQRALFRVYDEIKTGVEQNVVKVNASFPPEVVDELAKLAKKAR